MSETGDGLSRQRRRYLRRAAKVALGLVVAFVALFFVALIGARIYLNGPRSGRLAERIVDGAVAGRIVIGRFEWDGFPSSVVLHDVKVETARGEVVASAKRLAATIALPPLLAQRVVLTRIDAKDLDVRLVEGAKGFTLPNAFLPAHPSPKRRGKSGRSWRVDLRNVDVADLHFLLRTPTLEVEVDGGAMKDGRLYLDMPKVENDAERVAATRVRLRLGERRFVSGPIDVEGMRYRRTGRAAQASVRVSGLHVDTGRSTLSASGRAVGLSRGVPLEMAATGKARIDLADPILTTLLPKKVRTWLAPSGTVDVELQAKGTVSAPVLAARAIGRGLTVAGRHVDEIAVDAHYDNGVLGVERLAMDLPKGAVDATGKLTLSGRRHPFHGEVKARRLPLRRLLAGLVDPKNLPALVDGTMRVDGEGLVRPSARVDADLRVIGRPAVLPAVVPGSMRVVASGTATRFAAHLDELTATAAGVTATVKGTVPFDLDDALDVVVNLEDTRPKALLSSFGLPWHARRVSLAATVSGSIGWPAAAGTVSVTGLAGGPLPATEVNAPFLLTEGTLRLTHARVRTAGGHLDVDGSLALLERGPKLRAPLTVDAQLSAVDLDLATLSAGRASGKLFASGRVSGPPSTLEGRARVRAEGLRVGDATFPKAKAEAVLAGRTITLEGLEVRGEGKGTITGGAEIALGARTVTAHLVGKALDARELARAARVSLPLGGRVDVEGWARGKLTDPLLQASVTATGVTVRDTKLGSLEAWLRGVKKRIQIDASVKGPPGRLNVDGILSPLSGRLDLTLEGQGILVGALPGLAPGGEGVPPLDGRADVDLNVAGVLPVPATTGRITVTDLALVGSKVKAGDVVLDVKPGPGGTGLSIAANALGSLTADVDVAPGPPISVTARGRLAGFELGRVLPQLANYDSKVKATGDVDLHYAATAPTTLSASARLTGLTLSLADGELKAVKPVVASWDGETVDLEDLSLKGSQGSFHAAGRIGKRLDLSAKGQLETAMIAPFVSAIARATGPVDVDLHATGSTSVPELSGRVSIHSPVRLRPRTLFREVTLSAGQVLLSPGEARLERLTGEVDSGAFTASGQVALEGFHPGAYRLQLSGQNLPLRAGDMVLEANADLGVAGEGTDAKVSGRVDVVRGRYLRKFELKNFNFVARRTTIEEPLARRYPWLSNIALGIHATSTGGMEVRVDAGAFAMDLTFDADMQIGGTAADPVIEGRVSADHGTLTFPKAKLDVVRAVVEFSPTAGEGVHPEVDLRAEGEVVPPQTGASLTDVSHYITLSLQGNLDQMVLDLSSDPQLDKLEILSLLVTGRVNPVDLAAGGSAGDTSKIDAAIAFAGSQLAAPLTQFVTAQLERTLNLHLQLGAEVTSQGFTVTAGQEITRRLILEGTYQQNLAQSQSVAQATARFLLSDRIFLEGSTQTVSGAGTSASALREGARGRLELKLRIFGN